MLYVYIYISELEHSWQGPPIPSPGFAVLNRDSYVGEKHFSPNFNPNGYAPRPCGSQLFPLLRDVLQLSVLAKAI